MAHCSYLGKVASDSRYSEMFSFSKTATCGYGDVLDFDFVLERRDLLPFLLSVMVGVEFVYENAGLVAVT